VCPEVIAAGSEFLVDVVLHLADYELRPSTGYVAESDVSTLRLRAGAELEVRAVLDDWQSAHYSVDEEQARLVWEPPSTRVSFRFKAASTVLVGQRTLVRFEIRASGLRLCHFYVEFVAGSSKVRLPRQRFVAIRKMPQTAFASYASSDRKAVCERLQGLQSIGVDVFLDCLDLRAGENWEEALQGAVVSKDVFLLFWSVAASRSQWVAREWRTALEVRGLEYIVPNTLETGSCPPPKELAALHFGSRYQFAGGGSAAPIRKS
jgi:hypothetical protein